MVSTKLVSWVSVMGIVSVCVGVVVVVCCRLGCALFRCFGCGRVACSVFGG